MKCERCKRRITSNEWNLRQPMVGDDYGASHWFCDDCLMYLELDPENARDAQEAIECRLARRVLPDWILGVGRTDI